MLRQSRLFLRTLIFIISRYIHCEISAASHNLHRAMKCDSNPFYEEVVWVTQVVRASQVGGTTPIAETPGLQHQIESAAVSDLYPAA